MPGADAGLEWPVVFAVKWQNGVLVQDYRRTDDLNAFENDGQKLAHVAMKSDARVRGIELNTPEEMMDYLPKWLLTDLLHLDGSGGRGSEADLEQLPSWYHLKKSKQHGEV